MPRKGESQDSQAAENVENDPDRRCRFESVVDGVVLPDALPYRCTRGYERVTACTKLYLHLIN